MATNEEIHKLLLDVDDRLLAYEDPNEVKRYRISIRLSDTGILEVKTPVPDFQVPNYIDGNELLGALNLDLDPFNCQICEEIELAERVSRLEPISDALIGRCYNTLMHRYPTITITTL